MSAMTNQIDQIKSEIKPPTQGPADARCKVEHEGRLMKLSGIRATVMPINLVFDKKKIFRRSDITVPSPWKNKRVTIFRRKSLDVKKFSDVLSTEEYNAVDEPQYFGPYAHIRVQLDYTYHRHYRKERQW